MSRIAVLDGSRALRCMIAGAAEALGYRYLETGTTGPCLEELAARAGELSLVVVEPDESDATGAATLSALRGTPGLDSASVLLVLRPGIAPAPDAVRDEAAVNCIAAPFSHEELILRLLESLELAQSE